MKSDPNCPFCKIASGEFPSHKIYEDDLVIAILSIDPIRDGHSLIIPKEHWSKIWSIEDNETYTQLMLTARSVAQALNKTFQPKHLIELAEGMDVQHAHFHLIPSEKGYGHIAAEHKSKEPDHLRLEKLAEKIKENI
jgi:histidine triad (HIT) family protein